MKNLNRAFQYYLLINLFTLLSGCISKIDSILWKNSNAIVAPEAPAITLTNLSISALTKSSFQVTVAYSGDSDANAKVNLWYCNPDLTGSCDPMANTFVAMARDENNTFVTSFSSLIPPAYYPGENIVVLAVPTESSVEGSSLSQIISLAGSDGTETIWNETVDRDGFLLLGTATQLVDFSQKCRHTVVESCGANIKLANDIDMSGVSDFMPIAGTQDASGMPESFFGNFQGENHKISGLSIIRPTESYVALFSMVDGTISNLTLENFIVKGASHVGSLVGELRSGARIDMVVSDKISVSGVSDIGGLIGSTAIMATTNIYKVSSSGIVSGSFSRIGGLIGKVEGFTNIINSSSSAVVGSLSNFAYEVGGLIGSASGPGGVLLQSYSTGNVSATSAAGGLIGLSFNDFMVSSSYAQGNVHATESTAGGLVGISIDSTVISSYASGNVRAPSIAGGLIGSSSYSSGGELQYSFSTSTLFDCTSNCGGLIGDIGGTLFNPVSNYRLFDGSDDAIDNDPNSSDGFYEPSLSLFHNPNTSWNMGWSSSTWIFSPSALPTLAEGT